MKIVKTIAELRAELLPLKKAGKSIGLVPTMGALHEGHMSLVDASAKENDVTVVSVFLNPIQFGKNEDLDKYPRRLEKDAELVDAHGGNFVFAPTPAEMYPDGDPLTLVRDETMECLYCGATRPGHFRGVLTVVTKLFNISGADRAYFGKKDYQQAFLIKRMVKDLNMPIEIHTLPIVREASGLARSSRNEYMNDVERGAAVAISKALLDAKASYEAGEKDVNRLRSKIQENVAKAGGVVQYIEIASQKTLFANTSGTVDEPSVILIAAFFGKTRLIDNMELN
ncbi:MULTISPECIES: pantoate--beta-alanine ligase [Hallerella]|uniref:Pantothenate synthetase n=2 Tax=Hallerella succinigenes TaxID=1896222 RepID=A0A2M9A454_9BACT|nr:MULTISPECIES: pantoate--beta-alanine ligase [Hallerella]MBS7390678.1 pantoate--beta-alanine ligase [Fibrobacter sp.]MCI6872666.1 pantoate--beta-alanine ligase [Hallerella sp.]MDD6091434.1 pantoate--beta-alanine ligase [Hallerella succinigenes]PJJ40423.1 pantoate--beta-alanine ligase [Hallerella succinigenes]